MADPKNAQPKYQLKTVKVLNPNQQLCMVRFSPDGKQLVAGTFAGSIRRWDASTDSYAEMPAITGHQGWVQRVAFHSDNQRLFSADSWGKLNCWNLEGKEAKVVWSVPDAHDGWIHGLAISPDGKQLATCGRDQTVRLSNSADGKLIHRIAHPLDVLTIAFHPDGKSVLSGDLKGAIRQWDAQSAKPGKEFDARSMYLKDRLQDVGGVRCFAFDRGGETLIAGGSVPKSGGFVQGALEIILFDWKTAQVKKTIKGVADTEGYVYDMVFHPDGFLMAVSSGQPGQGKLFFQKLDEPQAFFALPLPNPHSLALHPNGQRLVVSATNGNSSGNGRQLGKDKEYPGNYSPLHLFDLPKSES
jgi:WD40 repeat protein